MNDRFLFRGKRIDTVGWEYGSLVRNTHSYSICFPSSDIETVAGLGQAGARRFYKVIPATIGQCTGLKDKNGKLLFEGDIARTKDYGKGDDYDTFRVVYRNASFCLENVNDNRGKRFIFSRNSVKTYDNKLCEIIGNVYDNPELMEA